MLVLGSDPFDLGDTEGPTGAVIAGSVLIGLALSVLCILRGKQPPLALMGIFLPLMLILGSIRLAKPDSWWARRNYDPGSRKQERSAERFGPKYQRRWERVLDLLAGCRTPPPPTHPRDRRTRKRPQHPTARPDWADPVWSRAASGQRDQRPRSARPTHRPPRFGLQSEHGGAPLVARVINRDGALGSDQPVFRSLTTRLMPRKRVVGSVRMTKIWSIQVDVPFRVVFDRDELEVLRARAFPMRAPEHLPGAISPFSQL